MPTVFRPKIHPFSAMKNEDPHCSWQGRSLHRISCFGKSGCIGGPATSPVREPESASTSPENHYPRLIPVLLIHGPSSLPLCIRRSIFLIVDTASRISFIYRGRVSFLARLHFHLMWHHRHFLKQPAHTILFGGRCTFAQSRHSFPSSSSDGGTTIVGGSVWQLVKIAPSFNTSAVRRSVPGNPRSKLTPLLRHPSPSSVVSIFRTSTPTDVSSSKPSSRSV